MVAAEGAEKLQQRGGNGRGLYHQRAEVDTKAMAVLQALACLKRVTSRWAWQCGSVTCFACETRPQRAMDT